MIWFVFWAATAATAGSAMGMAVLGLTVAVTGALGD